MKTIKPKHRVKIGGAAKPEKAARTEPRLKAGEDEFVEGLDDPDEDYARGVEELTRHVHPDAG